jgi:hypothetical protein
VLITLMLSPKLPDERRDNDDPRLHVLKTLRSPCKVLLVAMAPTETAEPNPAAARTERPEPAKHVRCTDAAQPKCVALFSEVLDPQQTADRRLNEDPAAQ